MIVGLFSTIVFGIIWTATRGNHSFWILPNLLEDVGIFDSFKPCYTWKVKKVKVMKGVEEEVVASDGEAGNDETKKDR